MSEMYGRQSMFILTYGVLTAFTAGAVGSKNVQTLLVLRFWSGVFGSSPLANAGGVIADMFTASKRGLALSVFAAAPFLGPTIGPIAGGFVGQSVGWKWVLGVMAIFVAVVWFVGSATIPETYAPVLLRKRAAELSKVTGRVYKSRPEISQGKVKLTAKLKVALSRPWILLFKEPIVLLLSIYIAIVYGTLYMLFAAVPIVFQEARGWSEGIGGLPFIGVAVGMIAAVIYTFPDNNRYMRVEAQHKAQGERGAPPEARLPPALLASVFIPVGLFIFAWTCYPRIHWIVPIIFMAPFGFGMVLIFLALFNYLIDAYTIYAASVLAANSILRSLFGAVFPLFTTYMYHNLGIHWASSIPAFLALACVPFPFLFYKYGPAIRKRCKYASEAEAFMDKITRQSALPEGVEKELRKVETQRSNQLKREQTNQTESSRREAEEKMGLNVGESDSTRHRDFAGKEYEISDIEKGDLGAEDQITRIGPAGDNGNNSSSNKSQRSEVREYFEKREEREEILEKEMEGTTEKNEKTISSSHQT